MEQPDQLVWAFRTVWEYMSEFEANETKGRKGRNAHHG